MGPAAKTSLLGLLLVLAAALFDAEPLYVPGVSFILLAAGATAWVLAAARATAIQRTVRRRSVVEEEPLDVELDVTCHALTLPAVSVEDALLPRPARLGVGRRQARLRISVRFARRGRKLLAPPRVVVRDPFGLATRRIGGVPAAEVLVLPRIEPVRAGAASGEGASAGTRRGFPFVAAEVDLDGLRPYRQGAPASRIFWPALARRGDLLERRLRSDSDTRPLVVLDPRAPACEEDLDAAVRATASLCVHLAGHGGCALLLPGDRRPATLGTTLAGWTHLHARLAMLGAAGAPCLATLAARRGPIVYVAARVLPRPPRALAHAPAGGRLLVVPESLPGRRPAFLVAGCAGYEVTAPATHSETAA